LVTRHKNTHKLRMKKLTTKTNWSLCCVLCCRKLYNISASQACDAWRRQWVALILSRERGRAFDGGDDLWADIAAVGGDAQQRHVSHVTRHSTRTRTTALPATMSSCTSTDMPLPPSRTSTPGWTNLTSCFGCPVNQPPSTCPLASTACGACKCRTCISFKIRIFQRQIV
jgi:hypothetical protein